MLIIYSSHEERLQCHVIKYTSQLIQLHITEDESGSFEVMERPYIPEADWLGFEATEVRKMTRPCSNLHTWAVNSLRKGSWTNTHMTEMNSCKEEVWSTFVRLLEISSPGLTQQLSKEAGVELDTKYVGGISAIENGHWVHVDNAADLLKNIINKEKVQYNESSSYMGDAAERAALDEFFAPYSELLTELVGHPDFHWR